MLDFLNNVKPKTIKYYSRFNINDKKNKAHHIYPKNITELKKIFKYAKTKKQKILCVGNSKSWFDTVSNRHGIIINLKKFNRQIKLNRSKNLCVSSNVTLEEIYQFLNPLNLTLYNLPGYLNITVGGCISNNVHGKDSFKFGTFAENIIDFTILLPNGKIKKCSKMINKEIFYAAIGGLGLIGIILNVKLNVKKITPYVITENHKCKDYKQLIDVIYQDKDKYDYIYSWVDTVRGRGIVFKSKHINLNSTEFKKNKIKKNLNNLKHLIIKFFLSQIMKRDFMSFLNYIFFIINKRFSKKIENIKDIVELSKVNAIDLPNLIYPNSFVEIQFIIPKKKIRILKNFLKLLKKENLSALITGIKIHKKSIGYLTFADEGISISINIICNYNDKDKISKIKKINNYIIKNKLKIYLAKDFFLDKSDINLIYPNFKKFLNVKKKFDKQDLLYSDFLRRIS